MKKNKIVLFLMIFILCFYFVGCSSAPSFPDNKKDDLVEEEENPEEEVEEKMPLTLSKEGGIYNQSFLLTVEPKDENNNIFYTLNTNKPTEDSSLFPENGLLIKDVTNTSTYPISSKVKGSQGTGNVGMLHGTTLRLLETTDEGKIVAEKTVSYVVTSNSDLYSTLPTVFLTVNKEEFITGDKGIYNTNSNGARNSCYGIIEYYNQKTNESFSRQTKIKVSGDGSVSNSLRTLNLNFNKDENNIKNEKVKTDIFNGAEKRDGTGKLTNITGFRLHSGGSVMNTACINSAYIENMVKKSEGAVAQYSNCNAFINGEYWGMYLIREHISDTYFEDNYSLDKNNVIYMDKGWLNSSSSTYITVNGNRYYTYGFERDSEEVDERPWIALKEYYDFINSHTQDMVNDQVYDQLCKMVDMDSLLDCVLAQAYCGNWDYMYNNFRMWRTAEKENNNSYADTRWRFVLHDTDYGFEYEYANNPRKVKNLDKTTDKYGIYTILDQYMGLIGNITGTNGEDVNLLVIPLKNKKCQQRMLERAYFIMQQFSTNANSLLKEMLNDDFKVAYTQSSKRWNIVNYDTLSRNMNTKKARCLNAANQSDEKAYFINHVENSLKRFCDKYHLDYSLN